MLIDPQVVHNYAHALFHVVEKEELSLDRAYGEAEALEALLRREKKFFIFLVGPQFREQDKEEVVVRVFQEQMERVFFLFVLLLLRRNRIEYLPSILEAFKGRVEEAQGFTVGDVITAVPLSEDGQTLMREKLEIYCQKTFHLTFRVDPRILGGVKVKYGDMLMDTTLETSLADLRSRLMQIRLAS